MPTMTRYNPDGFSPDGLSYSVANDFSKQMGQALAEYEARTKSPRYIPGAVDATPDSPEKLQQQLIDPVENAWNAGRPVARPIVHVVGNSMVQFDPRTNRTNVLYSNPPAPPKAIKVPELTKRQQSDLTDIEDQLKQKRKALLATSNPDLQLDIKNDLISLERKRQNVFAPPVSAAPPAPAAAASITGTNSPAVRIPQGIIGTPANNLFQGAGIPLAPTVATPKRLKYNPATGDFE